MLSRDKTDGRNSQIVGLLDIGTSKVACIIAALDPPETTKANPPHLDVLRKAHRRNHRVQREDEVDDENLSDHHGKGTRALRRPLLWTALAPFQLVVNLPSGFCDQEQSATSRIRSRLFS